MYPFRTSICGRTSTLSAEGGENYNWSPLGRVRARHVGVGACILNFAAPVFSYYFVINYSWGNVGWRFLVFLFPVWSFGIPPEATGKISAGAPCAPKKEKGRKTPPMKFLGTCVWTFLAQKVGGCVEYASLIRSCRGFLVLGLSNHSGQVW